MGSRGWQPEKNRNIEMEYGKFGVWEVGGDNLRSMEYQIGNTEMGKNRLLQLHWENIDVLIMRRLQPWLTLQRQACRHWWEEEARRWHRWSSPRLWHLFNEDGDGDEEAPVWMMKMSWFLTGSPSRTVVSLLLNLSRTTWAISIWILPFPKNLCNMSLTRRIISFRFQSQSLI